MDESLRRFVWERAGGVCEYCHMPSTAHVSEFQVDHVIARKHGGATDAANLVLACFPCNAYKGPNIAGIDPLSREIVPLFNPRSQRWIEHFRFDGAEIVGLTPSARATIAVLAMNDSVRVLLRASLIEEGLFAVE